MPDGMAPESYVQRIQDVIAGLKKVEGRIEKLDGKGGADAWNVGIAQNLLGDLLQRVQSELVPGGVCKKCAEKMGWTWPEGHVATCWTGTCDYCHERTGVCDESDWNHSGHEKEREL